MYCKQVDERTLAKNLGYPRHETGYKTGQLKGAPPSSTKKGQTDVALGIALPSVTSSYLLGQLFALPLSLSLYPLFVPPYIRFVPSLICGRCKFGQSSVQSDPVVSLLFRSVALTDLLCTPAVPQPQVGGLSLLLLLLLLL